MTSILHEEIYEQPGVIQRLLEREGASVEKDTAALRGSFDSILIAARGTSDNAARYAQYLFGAHNRLPVGLATPSLFTLYNQPPRLKRMLVIGISQSGQSPDIVAVLAEARRQGQPTLAITNDSTSPLAKAASSAIILHAGPEKAVAATKTYTASLAALALFSVALEEDHQRLEQLRRIPPLMQETLEGMAPLLERVERYRYMDHCAVIGRGYNYATAFEFALKIKELTGVVAEPYSSADFRHGPIAIVKNNFPVIAIAPSGETASDLASLVDRLIELKSELILVSDRPDMLKRGEIALPIPAGVAEWLSPLLTILPGQVFAMTLTTVKRLDPDHPEGLTKVTETF